MKPFLALREEKKQEAALKESVAEAHRHAASVKRKREMEEKSASNKQLAKAHGAEGHYNGISSLIEDLTMGGISMEQAKLLLIIISQNDSFKVISTSPQYVFYMLNRRGYDDPIQIAVERNEGEFYGQGTHLQCAYYRVIGVKSFQTVSGAETDLVIFKGVSATPSKASD